jgi:hypothetical protein
MSGSCCSTPSSSCTPAASRQTRSSSEGAGGGSCSTPEAAGGGRREVAVAAPLHTHAHQRPGGKGAAAVRDPCALQLPAASRRSGNEEAGLCVGGAAGSTP